MIELEKLYHIIEGALFATKDPLSIEMILSLFDEIDRPERKAVKEVLESLMSDYQERGIELKLLASGYQFQVRADFAPWVSRLWEEKPPRYSRALMETLAIIAYRQPVTRAEIEEIRGVVVSTNIVRTLSEHEWIHVVGYRDVPGKPGLYATTKKFLDNFGMRALDELPTLADIQDLDQAGKNLEMQLELSMESLNPMKGRNINMLEDLNESSEEKEEEIADKAEISPVIILDGKTESENFNFLEEEALVSETDL